jgi:serine/threonine protein kinase
MQNEVGPFILEHPLGTGAFATVFLARHSNCKARVAIKSILKSRLHGRQFHSLAREVSIQRSLQHPFVNEFFHVYETSDHFYLTVELVTGGTLLDLISKKRSVGEDLARRYFAQLVAAVEYLHGTAHTAHRDLKCENILIDRHDNIRLADFGLAHAFGEDTDGQLKTVCGSPSYIAPELLDSHGYTESIDIWALGIILYAMMVGRLPFTDASVPQTFRNIRNSDPPYPAGLSEDLVHLLHQLLKKSPEERIDIAGIKSHPWLAGVSWDALDEAVRRVGKRGDGSVDPSILEKMQFQGIDCKGLREAIAAKEDTELTMLYRVFRREKVTDRLFNCMKAVMRQAAGGVKAVGSMPSWSYSEEVTAPRPGDVPENKKERRSRSPAFGAGKIVVSHTPGLTINRARRMSPTHTFRRGITPIPIPDGET